jgi:hypothetical protein
MPRNRAGQGAVRVLNTGNFLDLDGALDEPRGQL